MGDGRTDINTPFFKDPFCLQRLCGGRSRASRLLLLLSQAVVKTHAPRRQETRCLTKSEKLWLRPIQGLGGGASEDGGRGGGGGGVETEEDYCPRL